VRKKGINKMAVKKADLIKILVEEYGYEKEDIKLFTNGKLQATINQEEEDAMAMEEDSTRIIAKESKIKDDDLIVVMNTQNGAWTHRSGISRKSWKFTEFGQTAKFPFAELLALRNVNMRAFEQGWFIVLNKDVQEQFGLTELYKNIITPDNIEEIFKKDVSDLEVFVDCLPSGMKTTFVAKARELHQSGKLWDTRIIKFVETKFGISLEDNAPLEDIV
jgi:hypothetical protein